MQTFFTNFGIPTTIIMVIAAIVILICLEIWQLVKHLREDDVRSLKSLYSFFALSGLILVSWIFARLMPIPYSAQKLAITKSQIIDIGIYLTISLLVVAIFATVVTEIIKMLR